MEPVAHYGLREGEIIKNIQSNGRMVQLIVMKLMI